MIQLAGRDIPEDQLLSVAHSVVLADGEAVFAADELPAGFVGLGDVYAREGQARFRFAVEFQLPAEDAELVDDNLTLLGSDGDAEAMEAFRFRAARSSRIEVNGRPGVVAEVGQDGTPRVVAWLAEDGLILRLFSFQRSGEELATLAAAATPVTGTAWSEMVDADPDPDCR